MTRRWMRTIGLSVVLAAAVATLVILTERPATAQGITTGPIQNCADIWTAFISSGGDVNFYPSDYLTEAFGGSVNWYYYIGMIQDSTGTGQRIDGYCYE